MTIKRLACLVAATMSLGASSAQAQSDWAGTGTDHLPPDPTVPYLPAVSPLICPNGEHGMPRRAGDGARRADERARLRSRRRVQRRVSDDHPGARATRPVRRGSSTGPTAINHEARTYAQEYFDQYDRWHAGAPSGSTSPAWGSRFARHDTSR